MENTFTIVKASRSSVFVRAIAASLVALMGITGLATPASANITPTLQSADVSESGGVSSLALITGVDRVVTISSTGETQSEITLRPSISATVSSATAIASGGSTTLTTAAAHGLAVGDTVTIAGLTPVALNGDRVVAEIPTATTFAFAVPEGVTGEVTVSSATAKRNDVTVTSSDETVVAVPTTGTTAAGKIPFTVRGKKTGSTVLTFTSPGRQPLAVNVTVTTPALKADVSTILVPVSGTPEIVTISSDDTTLVDRVTVAAASSDTDLVVTAVDPTSTTISSASAIADGKTTVTTATAHGLAVNDTVTISGLTPATLNGVRVVTAIPTTTSFTFAVANSETVDVTVDNAAVTVARVSGGKVAFAVSLAEGKVAADVVGATVTFATSNYVSLPLGLSPDKLKSNDVIENEKSLGSFSIGFTTGLARTVTIASFREAALATGNVTVTSSNTSVIGATTASSAASGKIPFAFTPKAAGTTVLTFSSTGRADLVVNATVTDPKLVSDVQGLVVTNESQNVTISSNDLRFTDANPITATAGTLVTAVSSDPELEVKPVLTSPVVAISSASTVAAGATTITTAAAHGFAVGNNVTIAGLTPASLNGVRVVTAVTATTFKFDVPAGVANDTAVTVASATARSIGHSSDGAVVFAVKIAAGADAEDVQGATITFSAATPGTTAVNYSSVVVTVAPDKLESNLTSNSVALLTGGATRTFEISSDVNALTDAEDLSFESSNSDVTVEVGQLVAGKVAYTIKGELAGSAVLTFSAPGRLDYVVNVTVTDPKLNSSASELLLTATNQNVVINSTELGLPVGTEVTAVASDDNLITVTPGDALVGANGSVTFAAKIAANKTAADFTGVETITFTSANYQDVVVTVAPDKLESSDIVLTSGSLNLLTGQTSATFNVNSDLNPLTSNATFTTSGEVTVTVGTLTNGKTPITVTGDLAGAAAITFSAPGRLDYVVNVTVTDPKLKAAKGATAITDLLLTTTNQTITISSTELALPTGTDVTAVASDDSLITVVPSNPDSNGDAVAANGTVSFDIKIAEGKTLADLVNAGVSISFAAANYEVLVANVIVPNLQSADVIQSEIAPSVYSLALTTGIDRVITISSDKDALATGNVTVTSSDETVVAVPTTGTTAAGKIPFTVRGKKTGSTVLTFTSPGRQPLAVNVTVTTPALKADVSTILVPVSGTPEIVTISSDDTTLVDRVTVAAASSDTDLVVTAVDPTSTTISSASAIADGKTTVTTATAHGLAVNDTVTISGLTPATLNGVRVVTAIPTTTSFTFAVANSETVDVTVDNAAVTVARVSGGKVAFAVSLAEGKVAADVVGATVTFATSNYVSLPLGLSPDKLKSNDVIENEKSLGSFSIGFTTGLARTVTIASFREAALATGNVTVTSSNTSVIGATTASSAASGKIPFAFTPKAAGTTVLTFSSTGRADLVVNATVTDPKLVSDVQGLVVTNESQNVTISSNDLRFTDANPITATAGTLVTAVSSDPELEVKPVLTSPVVAISSASTVAAGATTITTAAAHGFAVGNNVTIAGLTPASLNGVRVVTAVTATTFKFDVPAGVANDTAVTVASATARSIGHSSDGAVVFAVKIAAGADAEDVQGATITFSAATPGTTAVNYSSVVVTVAPDKLESNLTSNSVALLTGGATRTFEISSDVNALTDAEDLSFESSNSDVTVEVGQLVAGKVAYTIKGELAGSAVLTFSAPGRLDYVVNVTVTDPKLNSSASELLLTATNQNVVINSTELGLPVGTEVTAVASDDNLITVTPGDALVGANGSVTFAAKIAANKTAADFTGVETITFTSANYQDVVVTVAPDKLESSDIVLTSGSLNLLTGQTSATFNVNSDLNPLTSNATFTTSGEVTVTVGTLTNGKTPITVTGDLAGAAAITFSAPGRLDYVVNVTVTDPKLKAAKGATAITDLLLTTTNQTITISSTELALPTGTDVTAVASDDSLITVVPSNPDSNGDAVAANGTVSFEIKAVRGFASEETITFVASNYEQFVLDVTTAKLQSTLVVESEIAPGVFSFNVGLKGSRTLSVSSSVGALTSNATVVSSSASVSAVAGTLTDGKTPFTITGNAAGSAVLTFSAPGQADLVVNVTVVAPYLWASTLQTIAYGESKTITINSAGVSDATGTSPIRGISGAAIAGGSTTITTAVAHGFAVGAVVTITGLTPATLNGVRVVTAIPTTTSFSFAVPGTETGPVTLANATAQSRVASLTKVSAVSGDADVTVTRSGTSDNTFVVTGAGITQDPVVLTFTREGFTPKTVEVEVTKAALSSVSDVTSYDLYVSQEVSFELNSTTFPVASNIVLVATPSQAGVVQTTFDGNEVTIRAIAVGTSSVTISDSNGYYTPITIDVSTEKASLKTDDTSYDVIYGQSVEVTVSSDEVPFTAGVLPTLDNDSEDTVTVSTPRFVNGELVYTVTANAAGTAELKFERTGFTPVTASVVVAKASLNAESNLSTIFTGDTALVSVSSDTKPISAADLSGLVVEASDGEILTAGVPEIDLLTPNTATIEITGAKAGSASITVTLENYEDAVVQLTVTTPALKTDTLNLRAYVGVPLDIEVGSIEKALDDAVAVTAVSTTGLRFGSAGDCTDASVTGDGVTAGGVSVVTLCGITKGSYSVTLSAENYSSVTVRVLVVNPNLLSDVSKPSVFVKEAGEIEITSSETALPDDLKVTATSSVAGAVTFESISPTDVVTFVNTGEVDSAEGVAKFRYRANAAGVHRVVFSAAGFLPVTVIVNATLPALVADVSSVTVNNGAEITFTVSSNEVDIADDVTPTAQVASTGDLVLGSVEEAAAESGEAVVTFTAAAVGAGTITVTVPNYKPVTVRVTVLPARLELDVTAVSTTVWGISQIIVTSPDSDSFDPEEDLTTPVVAKDTVATVVLSDESTPGQAVYDVKGLEKGSTTVTFAGTGFLTVRASIKVALSTLSASSSSAQLFAGQEGSVTISSPDLDLTEDVVTESELQVVSSNEAAVVIGTEDFPYGIEYTEDNTLVIHFKGEAKGRSKITVTGTGLTKTGTTVNVVEPALLSNVSTLAFRADKSATFKISSNDLPLVEEVVLEFDDQGDLEDPTVVVADGIATVTLTGPAITTKAVISLVVKADKYKSKTIKVTVTPAPTCGPAKSLGSIKFSDTDAKLTSASTANIKKFAADLVNNKCSAAELKSYVPVVNNKANAAKYAKEVQLAASRESAVRSVLSAEIAKLNGNVTVTVVKVALTASDIATPTKQSAYRRIDVWSAVSAVSPLRLRNLI